MLALTWHLSEIHAAMARSLSQQLNFLVERAADGNAVEGDICALVRQHSTGELRSPSAELVGALGSACADARQLHALCTHRSAPTHAQLLLLWLALRHVKGTASKLLADSRSTHALLSWDEALPPNQRAHSLHMRVVHVLVEQCAFEGTVHAQLE